MEVKTDILEKLFKDFTAFVRTTGKEDFTSFGSSRYFNEQEKYKEEIYREARETIKNGKWKPEDIGTGKIHRTISDAIKNKANHNNTTYVNNLINNWRVKENFANFKPSRQYEQLLFDFYKDKGVEKKHVFDELIKYGHPYNLVAYLFFIKDKKVFLPISQQRFDKVFELIGLPDFKTSGNPTWENYDTFIDIVKRVSNFLRMKDKDTTLLDAHSFLWILGSQMQKSLENKPLSSSQASDPIQENAQEATTAVSNPQGAEPISYIAEEDDELSFPEGREFYRLHKARERNRDLIKAAKDERLRTDRKLCCDVCGFSFVDTYGELGEGFIEAHHLLPISELNGETETKISDLAMVCANCHRMLHRRRPWLRTVEQLRALISVKE